MFKSFTAATGLPCAHVIQERLYEDGALNLEGFHPHWFFDKPSASERPFLADIDLILDPEIVKAKGRPKGGVGKPKNIDKSTERNSS
jgi:hypothetical protein